jgi:exosortase
MARTAEHKAIPEMAFAAPREALSAGERWVHSAVVATLLLVAFWPILLGMYNSWFDQFAFMEHGILVFPAAAYMAWTKRDQLSRVPIHPSWGGALLTLLGALQAVLGVAAHWIWIGRTAFLVSLTGAIAALYGWRMVKELLYPLSILILMIAPPTFIYERLTLSLQLLASRIGEVCLEALGYSVLREGNILELVGMKLSVEEACSGIRSLLAILFMCVLYNYFFVEGKLMRTLILVLSVPIAILGNAARIVLTGIASQYNPELVKGVAHETLGYITVLVAAVGCVLLHLGMVQVKKAWGSKHA